MDTIDKMMTVTELSQELWIAQIFIVVLITVFLNWLQKRVIAKLIKKLEHSTATYWDEALVHAASKPLSLLILIIGLTFAADIVRFETNAPLFAIIEPIRTIGVVITVCWFLIRFIAIIKTNLVAQKTQAGENFDETTADAIAKLLSASVVITSLLVAMQTLGYSISGVLAFGGIGGIAVGFAAQDLLSNFFGGLMIYLDRPFIVGNWVRSPDREIEGIVEKIGWRLTTIRTFDKRPLYVPNSVFTKIAVENPSRMQNRRIYETIGIRYDDVAKMGVIVTDVKKMLQNHDAIDPQKTLIVNFNEFAASSLNFFIYTLTKTTNWVEFHEVKQDVLLKVIEIVEAHGAECAYPTSTLHVPQAIKVQHDVPHQ